jgi:transcriptional regulator with XRE-family HTH domain
MKIEAAHIRAARGLLNWTREALSERAGVGVRTLERIENGKIDRPQAATAARIRQSLEDAGVVFIPENGDGPGVRLKRREAG